MKNWEVSQYVCMIITALITLGACGVTGRGGDGAGKPTDVYLEGHQIDNSIER